MCLDGDKSGQQAAIRIAERLFPLINEEKKIFFSILDEGKDPDDIIKEKGKDGFLKILENKIIIQSYIWDAYVNRININNPYEVTKFEKEIRKLCLLIKDETLKKYILEDFLKKISALTPNISLKNNFKRYKNTNYKVLNETKKIHLQKKNFTRENLIEFSILFIMIFYSGAIKDNIEKLSKIQFSDAENENFKKFLIKLLGENNDIFQKKFTSPKF